MKKVFLQVSTHWDREWYKPFQGFRYDLVKQFDSFLDALLSGELDTFVFDGQVIALEDYLEIESNRKTLIVKYLKEGRIKIGPWYVMPDELLVSGESIIRNLLMAKQVAEDLGCETWKYGYACDVFGHPSQMPQIWKGFGINCGYISRGVGSEKQNYTNFIWESLDGSRIFCYKQNYGDLIHAFYEGRERGAEHVKKLCGFDDGTDCVILQFGIDHIGFNDVTRDFLKHLKNNSSQYEIVDGLEKIGDYLKDKADVLPVEKGELITTSEKVEIAYRSVRNSISSYYPLKQNNDRCESILERFISPLYVYCALKGKALNGKFLNLAYKYLLKNQPHDSICGCSSERVHKDMESRYSQVYSIAEAIKQDFLYSFASKEKPDGAFEIGVFSMSAERVKGPFVTEILLDKAWGVWETNAYQSHHAFVIKDEKGNEVPYSILKIEKDYMNPYYPYECNYYERRKDKYVVAIDSELNAFGYTVFEIVPERRKADIISVAPSRLTAENEYIRVSVNSDGTVDLTDKVSGKTYPRTHVFVDDAELGNGWHHGHGVENPAVTSIGSTVSVSRLHCSDLLSVFRIDYKMLVPKSADYENDVRSDDEDYLEITTDLTLYKGAKHVCFETTVKNDIKDHRLKIEFPTGICGDKYSASQAFAFVERNRGISEEGKDFEERETLEKNTSGIISVNDDKSGFSFIGKEGIHEGGVYKDGTVSVTLLRCFGRYMGNGLYYNPGGQISGDQVFRYAVSTETEKTELLKVQKSIFEKYENVMMPHGSNSEELLKLTGDVVLSIVKPAEKGDGIIVRIFNPDDKTAEYSLKAKFPYKKVFDVSLDESLEKPIENAGSVCGKLKPYQIKTIRFDQ